jgi:group I intron endonuclease
MIICGVYQIKNLVTGDLYIGSSNDILKRFKDHKRKLLIKRHHSRFLQLAYNKYSLINFEFTIICKCDKFLKLYIEQLYINSMNPKYNTAKSSCAPMEGRRHSEEPKLKFKNRVVRKGKDSPSYGKKWSDEYKKKWIEIRTGEKRSEEFSKKVSKKNIETNSIKYLKPYHETNRKKVKSSDGNVFKSLLECANFYNVKVATVCDVLKGRSKTLKRKFILEYC